MFVRRKTNQKDRPLNVFFQATEHIVFDDVILEFSLNYHRPTYNGYVAPKINNDNKHITPFFD
jgi:hypothetical protein